MMEVPGKKASSDQKAATAAWTSLSCQPSGDPDILSYKADTHIATKKKQGSKPTMHCKLQTDKLLEFYCRKHNVTACGTCVVIDHVSCQSEYIPDISLDYSDVFNDYHTDLEGLIKHVTKFLKYTEENIKRTKENGQHLVADFKRHRQEINHYLDRKEKDLKAEADKLQNGDLNQLRQIKNNFIQYKRDLTDAKSNITKRKGQSSDLFITSTEMITRVEDIQARVIKANSENKTYTYQFIKSDVSKDVLADHNGLGVVAKGESIQKAPKPLDVGRSSRVVDETRTTVTTSQINWVDCQPVQQPHLNVKSKKDKRGCNITGMEFLHPNILLLADYGNQCVKRVDVDTGVITGYLNLTFCLYAITALGLNQVAVTMPGKGQIEVISTEADLSIKRTLNCYHQCRGICSTIDNKLVVTFIDPEKEEIMDE